MKPVPVLIIFHIQWITGQPERLRSKIATINALVHQGIQRLPLRRDANRPRGVRQRSQQRGVHGSSFRFHTARGADEYTSLHLDFLPSIRLRLDLATAPFFAASCTDHPLACRVYFATVTPVFCANANATRPTPQCPLLNHSNRHVFSAPHGRSQGPTSIVHRIDVVHPSIWIGPCLSVLPSKGGGSRDLEDLESRRTWSTDSPLFGQRRH